MAARKYLGGLAAVAFVLAVAPAFAVSDADRIAVYKQFLVDYQAKRYVEAQPLAEQLVKLTEEQYGPDELALTNPLTNLATIHYKLGNYPAAIENYQRTLRILQAKSSIADKAQIRPLHGLGVSFLGAQDPESAVVALKRAADLSRNNDGLFNIGQVEFIDALVDAYAATGRYAESEKEAGYALRVEEAAYGRSSIKLLDRLDKLARWYEDDRRYTSERNTYERSLAILQKNGPPNDLRRIPPLRGIARSFRLEAFYGIEGADNGATFNTGTNGAQVFPEGSQQRRGETSLTAALAIIDSVQPADPLLRGVVLTDLGDWYLVASNTRRAYDSYAEAWKSLSDAHDTKLLEWPRVLAYRPSVSSVDRSQLDPKEAQLKAVELRFTVTRDGRLENVSSPTTDVPEGIVRNSVTSMRRSRYAPRIENGAAVATNDVVFVERVLVRAPSPDNETSSGKAAEKSPEQPAPAPAEEAQKKEEAPKP
ncbi:MAG: tetratricopeptide repeat protein [Pseudomonadota bacterium]